MHSDAPAACAADKRGGVETARHRPSLGMESTRREAFNSKAVLLKLRLIHWYTAYCGKSGG
jgi:hypothetical protein